jgi:hypothetical protein
MEYSGFTDLMIYGFIDENQAGVMFSISLILQIERSYAPEIDMPINFNG